MNWCNHKYGEIKEGYQYCKKCGKAKAAPKRECEHNWSTVSQYEYSNIINNNINNIVYVMRCSKCGDIKKVDLCD